MRFIWPSLCLGLVLFVTSAQGQSGFISVEKATSGPLGLGSRGWEDGSAAHASLPLGSVLRVANFETGRMTDVVVSRRPAKGEGSLVVVSRSAGAALGMTPGSRAPGSLHWIKKAPETPGVPAAPTKPAVAVSPPSAAESRAAKKGEGWTKIFPFKAGDRSSAPAVPVPTAAPASKKAGPELPPASARNPYRVQFGAFRQRSRAEELSGMLDGAKVPTTVYSAHGLFVVVTDAGFPTAEAASRWIDFEGRRRGWTERPVVIR